MIRTLSLATAVALPLAASLAASPWVAPSSQQVAASLARVAPGQAVVACATDSCLKVVDAMVPALQLKGWKVQVVKHGGLGIDGVKGVRVESCTDRSNQVVTVLRSLLRGAHVEVVSDGPCLQVREPWSVIVVIGATP